MSIREWVNDSPYPSRFLRDFPEGQRFITCDALEFGDYGGRGSVGRANIDALKADLDHKGEDYYLERGAYSSETLWLLDTPENRDIVTSLDEHYALYDESEHSRVEMEWEMEAFDSYARDELARGLPDELGDYFEDDIDADMQWELYRQAMEECNEYPIMENSGAYIRVERIQAKYNELVLNKLATI